MGFLTIYLIGYFLLVIGAVLVLWTSGILDRMPLMWVATAGAIAIGLGVLLAVASRTRRVPADGEPGGRGT